MTTTSDHTTDATTRRPGLFEPVRIGRHTLKNRVVLAPLTRNRAGAGNVPGPLNAEYYVQRATGGLLITEATQISPQGVGYPATPGIHSAEQVRGWRLVTDAVHARGGTIFLQLWHVGRISHPSLQPGGAMPVAPSAIAPAGMAMTYEGSQPFVTPRALETDEIAGIVEQYAAGASRAIEAGFDGVELHGANGYLIDQFIRDGSNTRTDRYGGPIENRARFAVEVARATAEAIGADRVGIRLSPGGAFNDMRDSTPRETFGHVVSELDKLGLAYLHINEAGEADLRHGGVALGAADFRHLFRGPIIACGDYTRERAEAALAAGSADLIAFGRLFLANPDLPERLRRGGPFNTPDLSTFYGGTEKGYTDYPALSGA